MKPHLLVIGLGNPGKSYERTRHNAGFRALDEVAAQFSEADSEWEEKPKFKAVVREARIVTVPILLVKPQTYMNNSGETVRKMLDFYKLDSSVQVLVIFDDIDLPLGTTRFRLNGGAGTHNGMRSIVATTGEKFPRLKLGVGSPEKTVDLATWILSTPPQVEEQALAAMYKKVPDLVKNYVMEHPVED